MSNSSRPGADPYAFDPAWYAQAYPDVLRQDPTTDLLGHFLRHGQAEGRARNALEAAGMLQGGGQGPAAPVERNPRLDPNDPASWARYQDRAHAATEGLNRMPRVAPDTASLGYDPLAVQRQFYPNGAVNTATAANQAGNAGSADPRAALGDFAKMLMGGTGTINGPGQQTPVQNLGMGRMPMARTGF
jgi:hypothetical protein